MASPIGGYLIGLAPNPGVSYELLSLSVSEARSYLEICSCPIRLVPEQPWCILVVSRAGGHSESPLQGRAQQPHFAFLVLSMRSLPDQPGPSPCSWAPAQEAGNLCEITQAEPAEEGMGFNLGEAARAAQGSSKAGICSAPAGPASTHCAMEFGTSVSTRAEVFSPKRGSKPSSSNREQLRSMAQPLGAGAAAEHQGAATNTLGCSSFSLEQGFQTLPPLPGF